MNILAIDTSNKSMSICIKEDDKIIGEINMDNGLVHSVQLMPCMENLFEMLDFDKKKLDTVAVCIGPGSFTGIRIGVATANAISFALKIPVVEISSLDLLAYNAYLFDGYIISTVDAQRGNYYVSIYKLENEIFARVDDYKIMDEEEINDLAVKNDKKTVILGDIWQDANYITENENIVKLPSCYNIIKSSVIANLAEEMYKQKKYKDFASPFYMRKSHAEVEYEKKHANNC